MAAFLFHCFLVSLLLTLTYLNCLDCAFNYLLIWVRCVYNRHWPVINRPGNRNPSILYTPRLRSTAFLATVFHFFPSSFVSHFCFFHHHWLLVCVCGLSAPSLCSYCCRAFRFQWPIKPRKSEWANRRKKKNILHSYCMIATVGKRARPPLPRRHYLKKNYYCVLSSCFFFIPCRISVFYTV